MADTDAVEFDPYAVLGVSPLAGPEEIHSAYRAIARHLHPDVNPADPRSAASGFAQATRAFELLSDDARRRSYDLRRSALHGPRAVRAAPGPTGNVHVRGPGAVPAHRARPGSAPSPSPERDPLAAVVTLAKVTAVAVVLLLAAIAVVALTSPPPCGPAAELPCRVVESPSPDVGG
jgi:hypothetical protein